MKKNLMLLLFWIAIVCVSGEANAQEYPPEPTETTSSTDPRKGDCGSGDGGTVGGVPPPVGLCLPINDYLVPLLLAGIALGAFRLWKAEQEVQFSG